MGDFNCINSVEEQKLTPDEIDVMVMKGVFKLESIGYGYTCIGGDISLPGGWKTKWINTQGMGNHGDLVIVPGDERTFKLYGYALEQKARESGLDPEFASVWASSKIQYKHELLDLISEVVKKPWLVVAYLAYPGYGPGKNRAGWEKQFNINDGLSAPRQSSLAKIILEFYEKGCINKNIVSVIAEKKQGAMDVILKNISDSLEEETSYFMRKQQINDTGAKLGDLFPNS